MTKIFNLNEHNEKSELEKFLKISEEIYSKIKNVPEDDDEKFFEIYQDLLKKYPDSKKLYSLAAMQMYEFKRLSDAENILRRGVEKFPDEFLLYYQLSFSILKQDRFDEAVEVMNRFSEKISEDDAFLKSEYLSGMASLYWEAAKEKEATEYSISSFENNNDNFYPIILLAINLDDYKELKSRSTLFNDIFTFIEIQIKKFLDEVHDDQFEDIDEKENTVFLICEVFKEMYEEEKENIKTMTPEEKVEYFEEIEIDFFDDEYLDDEYFDDDDIDEDFFDDDDEWIDLDDYESEADTTIYDILSEKDNEMISFALPLLGFAGVKGNRLQALIERRAEPTYTEQFLVKWGLEVVKEAAMSFFLKKKKEKKEHYNNAKQKAMEVLDNEETADEAVQFLLNIFKGLKN